MMVGACLGAVGRSGCHGVGVCDLGRRTAARRDPYIIALATMRAAGVMRLAQSLRASGPASAP